MRLIVFVFVCCVFLMQSMTFAKTLEPNRATTKRADLQRVFLDYGLDLERNFYLVAERLGLQEYGASDAVATRIYRALKKHDATRLVHVKCAIGEYKPLGSKFYARIGTVQPYFGSITSYQIQQSDGKRSPVYTLGVNDIDNLADNCNNEYVGKDDKPAQCARRMRSYFGTNAFRILGCRQRMKVSQ